MRPAINCTSFWWGWGMSDATPSGWKRTIFKSICRSLVNGGTPDTGNDKYWGGNTPWVTGADFTFNGIGEIRRYVTDAGIRSSSTNVVRTGNLLLVTRTGVGKLAIASSDIAISQDITGIYLDENEADSGFVYFLMRRGVEDLKKRNQGTSINGIIRSDLEGYVVQIPRSLTEQKRIASILSTLENAIEKTEALIAKYQQIKAGLMHDLFARGVTADGKLRPPREQAPELYRETPIGWIPKEWEVGSLAKFLIGGPKNGYSPPEVSEWSGFFSLGLGCLTASGFRPRQIKVVSGASDAACAAIVNDGDLLLSRSNTCELVGLCGIYRDIGGTCIYPDLMMRIKPNAKTSAAYLEAFLLTPKMRLQITAAAVGTSVSMVKLNSKSVLRLEISMPKPDEQLQILRIIEAQRSQLESFEEELSKLRQQKSGLMSDLLTGRVRVKLAETEVVPA